MKRRKLYKISNSLFGSPIFQTIVSKNWAPISLNIDVRRKKENASLMSKSLNSGVPDYPLRQPKRKTRKK